MSLQSFAEQTKTESTDPDFSRILASLQKESSLGLELANRLTNISHSVKNMDMPIDDGSLKEKDPSCLVDFLWSEIWKIQRNSKQIEKCVNHLQKTIGT